MIVIIVIVIVIVIVMVVTAIVKEIVIVIVIVIVKLGSPVKVRSKNQYFIVIHQQRIVDSPLGRSDCEDLIDISSMQDQVHDHHNHDHHNRHNHDHNLYQDYRNHDHNHDHRNHNRNHDLGLLVVCAVVRILHSWLRLWL